MGITLTPVSTDIRYRALYKETQFDLLRLDSRFPLLNKIMKIFDLRLNDLRFNEAFPSDNHIHFSKFYGPTFFDVSFGLEEVAGLLQFAQNEEQIADLYGKLSQLIEGYPLSFQRMIIQQHSSIEGDITTFLESLSPPCPEGFKELLRGTGAIYTLVVSKHNLTINMSIVESLYLKGGLYIYIENEFSPAEYDLQKTFDIVREYYYFILKELNIDLREVENGSVD